MKYLIISTTEPNLRSTNIGYDDEDSMEAMREIAEHGLGVAVGMIRGGRAPMYNTPLHALGDGWRLLGPPQHGADEQYWDWWLTKEE